MGTTHPWETSHLDTSLGSSQLPIGLRDPHMRTPNPEGADFFFDQPEPPPQDLCWAQACLTPSLSPATEGTLGLGRWTRQGGVQAGVWFTWSVLTSALQGEAYAHLQQSYTFAMDGDSP